jgi:L-ascorbate metabolism protein UlaG (beta-lactamase superfamily)
MKITKLGHCCLVIDIKGIKFLTDPGNYTTTQNDVTDINYVVISHEHTDHLHIESLKKVLANNPTAKVITNTSVGKILDKENISYIKVINGESFDANGISIKGYGEKHALIYKDYEQVENTGYLFDNTLFYPGDAFHDPEVPVDILAFPIGAPWSNINQSMEYVLKIKPRVAFPVHDGNLIRASGVVKRLPELYFPRDDIQYIQLEIGKEIELKSVL